MNNKWVNVNSNFHLSECSNDYEKLPVGIYKTDVNPRTMEIFLVHIGNDFQFPYKVYGIEEDFIDRVVKSYHHTKGNMGILLNGVKGTGKTVTAELICNKLELPVIIVQDRYDNFPSFINNIQQDVIVFFDEFEKMYNDYQHDILTVMDGVLSNEYRKTFLLTTNKTYLNENMLQRPSRIRYVKHFKDLPLKSILEIIDDKLVHTHHRETLIEFISTLEIVTVDIVKSLVDEVNIHNNSPEEFKNVFNVNAISNSFNVFFIENGVSIPKFEKVKIQPMKITNDHINQDFNVNSKYVGEITGIIDDDTFMLTVENDDDDGLKTIIVKIEQNRQTHKSFINYAF